MNGQKIREVKFMQRAIAYDNSGICVVCNRNIKKDSLATRNIDGLCVCSLNCADKFLKEKNKWTSKEWDELCKMQALFEERKRAEIKAARKEFSK